MSIIKTLVDTKPSLILDFANGRRINPAIIHSRAGIASMTQDGLIKPAAIDVPRLDYLAGTCRGLLTEGPSTNYLRNSKLTDGSGWTVSSSGTTMTLEHNLASPVAGAMASKITTLEIANGTSRGWTQNFNAAPNSTYTYSVYLKMAEGSKPCQVRLRAAYTQASDGAGFYLADMWHAFSQYANTAWRGNEYIGNGWWRAYLTLTTPADIAQLNFGIWMVDETGAFQFASGGHSVYVTAPQAELMSVATSAILTDPNATASRVADASYIDIAPYISSKGFSVACVTSGNYDTNYPIFFTDNIAGLGNYIGVRLSSTGAYVNSVEGGRTGYVARPENREKAKVAATFSDAFSAAIVNGLATTPSAGIFSGTDFSARRYMKFNRLRDVAAGHSLAERVYIWNRVMTQAELAVISKLL